MLLVYFGPNKKSFSNIAEMCQICTTGDMDKGVRMNLSWDDIYVYISQKIIMCIGLNYINAFILS